MLDLIHFHALPVHVSAGLHIIQSGDDRVQVGEEGVAVDIFCGRVHLVQVSIHTQAGVDVKGCHGSRGALGFLDVVRPEEELSVEVGLFYQVRICYTHLLGSHTHTHAHRHTHLF